MAYIFLILIAVFIFFIVKKSSFKNDYTTEGICVDVIEENRDVFSTNEELAEKNRLEEKLYTPVIRYTYDDKQYIAKSNLSFSRPNALIGDKVVIDVDLSNMEVVRIIKVIKEDR